MQTTFLLENLKETDHVEDLDTDRKIISEWTLENGVQSCGLDSSGWGNESVVGSCECGNEPLGLINGVEFFDLVSDY